MLQRQWEEEYEIHMYSGEGENGFHTIIFKHHSFTVLKKTNCFMQRCFKDNAIA